MHNALSGPDLAENIMKNLAERRYTSTSTAELEIKAFEAEDGRTKTSMKSWQFAKEYQLVAEPSEREQNSDSMNMGSYDVHEAWRRLRASHVEECLECVQFHHGPYFQHLQSVCTPLAVELEVADLVTRSLSRHENLNDHATAEDQRLRACQWMRSVINQYLVAEGEELKARRDEEVQRQEEVDNVLAVFQAMDARSFVLAFATWGSGASSQDNRGTVFWNAWRRTTILAAKPVRHLKSRRYRTYAKKTLLYVWRVLVFVSSQSIKVMRSIVTNSGILFPPK